jgi:hypothetical protein
MTIFAILVYTENICCAVDHRLYDQELELFMARLCDRYSSHESIGRCFAIR